MKTPYFVIIEDKLKRNILEFKSALRHYWPNSQLAYSVKTNSLPWLLEYLRQYNVMAEVVSDEEYQLALLCGYPGEEIIFNGPIKSNEQLLSAIDKGSIANLDSKREIDCIELRNPVQKGTIGVRINVDTSNFDIGDVDFMDDGFRFGFSEESGELEIVIKKLIKLYGKHSFGLHFHCNSITRSLRVYEVIARYAAKIIKKYDIEPTFINVGGGFFGDVEGKPSAEDYISTITNVLKTVVDMTMTKLFIEPGSAIIGSVIDYHISVLDVKDTKKKRIITTDGSRIHIDPLWQKSNYFYTLNPKNSIKFHADQIICGYTCMDHDRIMVFSDKTELQIGDEIVFHKVGAYSVTFGGPFIRYFPDVYVKRGSGFECVRNRMSVGEYYKTQSVYGEDRQ